MKLRITILKYHSWYLCQISLQIMLLPIQIQHSLYCLLNRGVRKFRFVAEKMIMGEKGLKRYDAMKLTGFHGISQRNCTSKHPPNYVYD